MEAEKERVSIKDEREAIAREASTTAKQIRKQKPLHKIILTI